MSIGSSAGSSYEVSALLASATRGTCSTGPSSSESCLAACVNALVLCKELLLFLDLLVEHGLDLHFQRLHLNLLLLYHLLELFLLLLLELLHPDLVLLLLQLLELLAHIFSLDIRSALDQILEVAPGLEDRGRVLYLGRLFSRQLTLKLFQFPLVLLFHLLL